MPVGSDDTDAASAANNPNISWYARPRMRSHVQFPASREASPGLEAALDGGKAALRRSGEDRRLYIQLTPARFRCSGEMVYTGDYLT
jgi:hypothetical protein